MTQRNPVRLALSIAMNVLVVIAVAVTARLVVLFFGQLASQGWAEALVALTDLVTIPLGFESIKTPYGGVFDLNAAATVIIMLAAEWLLSVLRARA